MSIPSFCLILLSFIAICIAAITVLLLTTYRDIVRVLHQLQETLPTCRKTFQEAQGVLQESRQILHRAHGATEAVEKVVHRGCRAASEALDQFLFLKKRAVSFIGNRFAMNGNGARHSSRRHS